MASNELVTTNFELDLSVRPQIPVDSDGDFLYDRDSDYPRSRAARARLYGVRGFQMYEGEVPLECAGLQTPTDEQTGLPLPTIVVDPPSPNANTDFVDYHHHFHPRVAYEGVDDATWAVRTSRGQDLPRWLHEHYHRYFAGPQKPESREQAFIACVMACAGVVPRQAIDFSGDGPKIVEASNAQYEVLAHTIRREGSHRWDKGRAQRNRIGMFFASYAVEQAIEHEVSDRDIYKFLYTRDNDRRLQLGNKILKKAVNMSIEPVRPLYRNLRKEGLVTDSSPDPWNIVTEYFVAPRLPDYHIALKRRLRQTALAS